MAPFRILLIDFLYLFLEAWTRVHLRRFLVCWCFVRLEDCLVVALLTDYRLQASGCRKVVFSLESFEFFRRGARRLNIPFLADFYLKFASCLGKVSPQHLVSVRRQCSILACVYRVWGCLFSNRDISRRTFIYCVEVHYFRQIGVLFVIFFVGPGELVGSIDGGMCELVLYCLGQFEMGLLNGFLRVGRLSIFFDALMEAADLSLPL